ncbi:hypothetical protein [Ascidiimonas sp. W6]|uniref:hypothetical protein n=1 Tax=Ascidiimonas meishanensis TaxID=3128903 RepID=UPI0030EDD78D
MQNELPNTAQEPVQVNNGLNEPQEPAQGNNNLNEPPIINANDLRQRVGTPIRQNPINALQRRLPRINQQALKFNAIGFTASAITSIYNIALLAKKNKSEADKSLIPFNAVVIALSTFALGFLAKRSIQNQTDSPTVASSTDLRQEQEAMRDEELGNQQENVESSSVELTSQQANNAENSNSLSGENQSETPENAIHDTKSMELALSNLAAVPEKRIRSNSTTRLDSQVSSNESKVRFLSF